MYTTEIVLVCAYLYEILMTLRTFGSIELRPMFTQFLVQVVALPDHTRAAELHSKTGWPKFHYDDVTCRGYVCTM